MLKLQVIKNSQRDINIANGLAKIFNLLDIDTNDVLEAAEALNFLPFKPGIVGGHCIGVDPFILLKAQEVRYYPELFCMKENKWLNGIYCIRSDKWTEENHVEVKNSNILLLGITFKENCPDIRNSKAIDIYKELTDQSTIVDVYDSGQMKK